MKITRNTFVKVKQFQTEGGCGCSIFTTIDGDVILDETIGLKVKFLGGTGGGKAEGFGALRAKFGWKI